MRETLYRDRFDSDDEAVEHFVRSSRWRFAWTQRWHPHFYTVLDREQPAKSTCESEAGFAWFAAHIREHGYAGTFGKRTFTYFEAGLDGERWRYWTMGNPIAETTIINRARV